MLHWKKDMSRWFKYLVIASILIQSTFLNSFINVESVKAEEDVLPNITIINPDPSNSYFGPLTWTDNIDGTATTGTNKTITQIDIEIKNNTDTQYWNGSSWAGSETWNTATGTSSWSLAFDHANLTNGKNYTVTAKVTDSATQIATKTLSFTYDNITPTDPTFSADIITATNHDVVVTITFSADSLIKQYSLDGTTYDSYTTPITMTANGTIYAKSQDFAGNWSNATNYDVTNIDKTKPIVTGVINNAYYNGSVIITFDKGTATLNDSAFTSGTTVSTEGTYTLIVTDSLSNSTTVTFIIDKTRPDKPVNFCSESQDSQIKLTWDKISDAANYNIKYHELNSDTYTTINVTAADINSYTVTGLTNGTTYEFLIQSKDRAGNVSDWTIITASPTAPVSNNNIIDNSNSTQTVKKATYYYSDSETTAITNDSPNQIKNDDKDETNMENDDNGDVEGQETDNDTQDSSRSIVTIAILIIAAGAGLGGYYGYQWWLGKDDTEPQVKEKTEKLEKDNKKKDKPKDSGRW